VEIQKCGCIQDGVKIAYIFMSPSILKMNICQFLFFSIYNGNVFSLKFKMAEKFDMKTDIFQKISRFCYSALDEMFSFFDIFIYLFIINREIMYF
jgi:hypothetical protein